jgi:hypothetical protein
MGMQKSSKYYAFLSIGSLLISAISFSGIFYLKVDLTGRILVGLLWGLVSIGWIGQYFQIKKKLKQAD